MADRKYKKKLNDQSAELQYPKAKKDRKTWHNRDVDAILHEVDTSLDHGLDPKEAQKRLAANGKNTIVKAQENMVLKIAKMILYQFSDFMVILLLVAGILSLVLRDWIEAGTLFIVVFTNVVIGFGQEYKAEKALQSLKNFNTPTTMLIRGSKTVNVPTENVVVGDIVTLEEGSSIPADIRLFEAVNLQVMEAVLTGESVPVSKTVPALDNNLSIGERTNMGYMSTTVVRGRGKGIVVCTGQATEVGKISKTLTKMQSNDANTKTLLQKRIKKLGAILVVLSIVLCVLIVGIGFLREYIEHKKISKKNIKNFVTLGVSLAVSVIPEGLVAVVTITFALGVQRMASRNAIVRKLSAVETLGSITTICSDKTGTLTVGKMKTEKIWIAHDKFTVTGLGYDPTGVIKHNETDVPTDKVPSTLRKALMIAALCNNSSLQEKDDNESSSSLSLSTSKPDGYGSINENGRNPKSKGVTFDSKAINATDSRENAPLLPPNATPGTRRRWFTRNYSRTNLSKPKQWKGLGDPTEVALEVVARKAGMGKQFWLDSGLEFVNEIPFDSDRSRMTVVYRNHSNRETLPGEGFKTVVLSKGSPASLLECCSKILWKGEKVVEKSEELLKEIEVATDKMAIKGLRILGLAYRTMSNDVEMSQEMKPEDIEKDLVFVGLVGMIDPPRKEVKFAIEECQKAGIQICMITGDHHRTAFGIALSLGILSKGDEDLVMEGPEIDSLSTKDLVNLETFPVVFARVSPENKLKIVRALKKRGEVVAMTGDGVNDAPAIKFADAGISMGLTGTDLTKESSDIILTDDNLNSIVPAIEEGRRTFDNIQKFIFYLLSCNSAEIYIMFIAITFGLPVPFTPVMILWANIIIDVPPALALGVDPPERNVLSRPPRNPKSGIFENWKTYLLVVVHGLSIAGLTIGLFLFAIYYLEYDIDRDPEKEGPARSLPFIGLGVLQLIHAFLARSIETSIFHKDFWTRPNWWLVGGVAFSMVMLVSVGYIPVIRDILNQWPLGWVDWVCIGVALLAHIIIVELLKLVFRHVGKSKEEEAMAHHHGIGRRVYVHTQ